MRKPSGYVCRTGPARTALLALGGMLMTAVAAASPPLQYERQPLALPGETVVVQVPAGQRLELLTAALDGPRLLSFAADGELFIGSRSGKVYRLAPPYTAADVLVEPGGYPHSVARRAGEILIARTDGLYRADYEPGQARIAPAALSRLAALPGGSGHNSRSVAIGPDGRVYLSLGIRGNCSDEYLGDDYPFDARRGGILVLNEAADPPRWEAYGSGLRNPVGFDWHPRTGELYASNNGPDHHGYAQPPEYFSRITAGSFHGMPWFQFDGERLRRDACIKRPPPRPLRDVTLPVATFPARNAPMGVAFVPAGALGGMFDFDAVVALRGSWGTQPDGGFAGDAATRRPPKLVRVRFEGGQARAVEDLVTGFQAEDGRRWARPVGVAVGPDGALYFTSDSGVNGLFRLTWRGRGD